MRGRNYITLRGGTPGFVEFMFIDTPEYLGDQCLIAEKTVGHFRRGEYRHEKFPGYCMVLCKVRKKNVEKMKAAMDRLCDKMLVLGHTDYLQVCDEVWEHLCNADEKFKQVYGK